MISIPSRLVATSPGSVLLTGELEGDVLSSQIFGRRRRGTFARSASRRVARASRVLVSASRRNNLFWEVREGWDAFASTRDARATRRPALPRRDTSLGM